MSLCPLLFSKEQPSLRLQTHSTYFHVRCWTCWICFLIFSDAETRNCFFGPILGQDSAFAGPPGQHRFSTGHRRAWGRGTVCARPNGGPETAPGKQTAGWALRQGCVFDGWWCSQQVESLKLKLMMFIDFPIFCWCQFLLAVPLLHGHLYSLLIGEESGYWHEALDTLTLRWLLESPGFTCVPLLKNPTILGICHQEICRKTWNWKPGSRLGRFGVSSCVCVYRRYDLMEFFCYDGFFGLQKAQERHDVENHFSWNAFLVYRAQMVD